MGREDDFQLKEKLKEICDEMEEPYVHIMTTLDARMAKSQHNNTKKGVFVLEREFARGYDLKLGKEALVLILANDSSIRYAEAI